VLLTLPALLQAAPAPDVLERPAMAVRHVEQTVLLGIAHAGSRLVAVGERGLIILSDDDGRSWHQAPSPVSVSLTSVFFLDADKGWIVGHQGVVLASTDGGDHWRLLLQGRAAAQLALTAAQSGPQDPQAAGSRQLKEARRLVAEGADKPFFDLYFADAHEGWVVGAFGLCFHTDDGGKSWQSWMAHVDNPDGFHLYAMAGRGRKVYIVGEQGLLLRSLDGGRIFQRLKGPTQTSFFTLRLFGEADILVAGMAGQVLHSADGGQHWRVLSGGGSAWLASAALGAGRVVLADQSGRLMLASIARSGLQPLPEPPLATVAGLAVASDGSLITVGYGGLRRLPAPPQARQES
jgi:photosystem II stability/assembly factor-like uncharacterized protein